MYSYNISILFCVKENSVNNQEELSLYITNLITGRGDGGGKLGMFLNYASKHNIPVGKFFKPFVRSTKSPIINVFFIHCFCKYTRYHKNSYRKPD